MNFLFLFTLLALNGLSNGWIFTKGDVDSEAESNEWKESTENSAEKSEWTENADSEGSGDEDMEGSGDEDMEGSGDEDMEGSGESGSGCESHKYPIDDEDGSEPEQKECPKGRGWVERDEDCYLFSALEMLYLKALRMCHNHGATLYSPSSRGDIEWFVHQWKNWRSSDQDNAWYGCSEVPYTCNKTKWDCDGVEFDFTDWGSLEPRSFAGRRRCMSTDITVSSFRSRGSEKTRDCSLDNLPFTCKAGCPEKPNWVSRNGNCYYFSKIGLSYLDAEKYCHNRGLRLWSPDNDEDQQFFKEYFDRYGGSHNMAYIGCTDRASQGYWTCDDGHGAPYNYFGEGDPSNNNGEDCAVTYIKPSWSGYGAWWDHSCDLDLPFVCSYW